MGLSTIVVRTKKEIEGVDVKETDITDEDIEEVLKQSNPSAHKIFRATFVEDNALWEPYYDAEKGGCVRINSAHRFARLIFEDNSSNIDLQIVLELLLLQMSEAEIYTQKALTDIKRELIDKVISEFRRNSSEYLATMCRKIDDKLPPFEK